MNEDINQELEESYSMLFDVLATIAIIVWALGCLVIAIGIFIASFTYLITGAILLGLSGGFNRVMDYLTWRK